MLTQEYLKSVLSYDPLTGVFIWVKNQRPELVNQKAGRIQKPSRDSGTAYVRIKILYTGYLAHRLAWLYMTGSFPLTRIDHKDGNGLNNSWKNLREATQFDNTKNAKLSKANTSGVKGVSWHRKNSCWTAQIRANGITHYLGSFAEADKQLAIEAVRSKRTELHGEFANHG